MVRLLKRLLCRHPLLGFVRNVYGDEINQSGGRRSVWQCKECGARVLRDQLHTDARKGGA